jgi:RimJ/RimL family protein N-acetyltransferase
MAIEPRLRQIEAEDLPQLRDWRNDPRLRHSFREHRLLNMLNQRDWWERVSRDNRTEMFGIEAPLLQPGWTLVGVCGLCYISWVNRTAEVSIYIGPDYWRRGLAARTLRLLATKAFGEFNLQRLWAEIHGFNVSSVKLFEAAGYVLEGTLRRHIFIQGQYHDSFMYGLLREEAGQDEKRTPDRQTTGVGTPDNHHM